MKPSRIRVLDLPFTAVEWVLPEELSPAQYLGRDKWIVWERSPLARERSLFGSWDEADDGQLAGAAREGPAHGEENGHHRTPGMCLRGKAIPVRALALVSRLSIPQQSHSSLNLQCDGCCIGILA